MPRYSKQDAREIAKLVDAIPMPTPSDIMQVKAAAYACSSIQEFAEALDITPIAFKIWIEKSLACRQAFLTWKDHKTNEIERALAKRAMGFTKSVTKQILTRTGQVEDLVTEEYFAPDVAAIQFWLKNRAPADWKDKSEVDINVAANIRAWMVAAATGDAPAVEAVDAEFVQINGPQEEIVNAETNSKDEIQNNEKELLAKFENKIVAQPFSGQPSQALTALTPQMAPSAALEAPPAAFVAHEAVAPSSELEAAPDAPVAVALEPELASSPAVAPGPAPHKQRSLWD